MCQFCSGLLLSAVVNPSDAEVITTDWSAHVDGPDHGCQPEDERLSEQARLTTRLASLQEELRRQNAIYACRSSFLASLIKLRDDALVKRYLLKNALAAVGRKKQFLKLQARLWRGIAAVRLRSLSARMKEKDLATVDRRFWKKRLKLLVGELAMRRRELAALEEQEREQTDSIHRWFDRLPTEEASFLSWYEEEVKADVDGDADSMRSIRTTHALPDGP